MWNMEGKVQLMLFPLGVILWIKDAVLKRGKKKWQYLRGDCGIDMEYIVKCSTFAWKYNQEMNSNPQVKKRTARSQKSLQEVDNKVIQVWNYCTVPTACCWCIPRIIASSWESWHKCHSIGTIDLGPKGRVAPPCFIQTVMCSFSLNFSVEASPELTILTGAIHDIVSNL